MDDFVIRGGPACREGGLEEGPGSSEKVCSPLTEAGVGGFLWTLDWPQVRQSSDAASATPAAAGSAAASAAAARPGVSKELKV